MTDNQNSEFKSPLLKTINDFMKLIKGFMILVFIGYLLSGITLIQPDEVGIIFRMGKLVGDNTVDQIHEPGWTFALPAPFDEVLKIPVKKVLQTNVTELAINPNAARKEEGNISSIDPTIEGYCISGDENIFQTSIIVKYQISDPIKLVLGYSNTYKTADNLIHDLTVSEMINVSCGFTIDGLLTKDKKELSKQVKDKIQNKLEKLNSGLSIVSFEITEMVPPPFLKFDFEDVQSAFVDQHQFVNKAKSRKETKLPEAQSAYEEKINNAMAYSEAIRASAESEAYKFTKLLNAYEKNPEEVSHEMKSNILKKLVNNAGNIIVFPDAKNSKGNVSLFLGMNGSVQTTVTTPDGYYEGAD